MARRGIRRAYLIEKLEVGKWIFLWVVLAEAGSLVLATIMRCMGEMQGRYAAHFLNLPICAVLLIL